MYYVGVDLGQRHDHTAIAVVQRRSMYPGCPGETLHSIAVVHVEQMPLGTLYTAVVQRVKEIVEGCALRGSCTLALDATGVGAPIVDMLRGARLKCSFYPVTITGGAHSHWNAYGESVPKKDLVAGLRVLLEKGMLRIAKDLKGSRILMRELMDMQVREKKSGAMRIGADGYGQHDDVAMALALACWKAKQFGDRYVMGRLY
jgi:hypothetical protein